MSADYTAPVEIIPDPTHAEFFVWVVEWEGGGTYLSSIVPPSDMDAEAHARLYDPRKNKGAENARAALVKITVPLSELRRLS